MTLPAPRPVLAAPAEPSVLLVGNFLSGSSTTGSRGVTGSRAVCEDLAERLAAAGLEVHTTSRRRPHALRLADMLAAITLKRHRYQVAQVDVYSGRAFFWAEAACSLLRRFAKPYVLTLHGGGLPLFASKWPRRVGRLLAGAHTVTSPSRYLERELSRFRARVVLLPNPVDLEAYDYQPRLQPAPRLVWLRAIHEVYNPELALRALALVRQRHPAARLQLFGPVKQPELQRQLDGLARQLGLGDAVAFRGAVPKQQVPERLREGDIFINTSSVDNAPVSVLEPMALGIPVVSTNAGGLPDLLNDGENALLVPVADSGAMAAAVCRLLDQPGLAAALAGGARRMVEQRDWSHVLPRWRQLLAAAAQRNLAPRRGEVRA